MRDRRDVLASAADARKNGQYDLAESKQFWYARKTAPEHVKLGLWCEQNGLKAEAIAHFTQAVVLDPYRDATWKHLGYVKHDGRWVSREQAEAEPSRRRGAAKGRSVLGAPAPPMADRARGEVAGG